MRLMLKPIYLLIIILISFFIPLFSAYTDYQDLIDFDFPSQTRRFENPDQVDLLVAQRNEPKLFISDLVSITIRTGVDLLEQFSRLSLQTPSSGQETTILRC